MNWKIAALVLGAFAILVGALVATGAAPSDVLRTVYQGTLASPRALSNTLRDTTPLLILGVGVFLALRAGLFNIGIEGQFLVGAAAAAAVTLSVPGPVGWLPTIGAALAAGALWALPAGLIKAYRGGHEVITTIMLNNVAVYLTGWLVAGPLKDPTQQSPTTARLDRADMIPSLAPPPLTLSPALLVGVLLVVGLAIWMRRSVSGYELRLTGANPRAARVAGVQVPKVIVGAMLTSGAIGGLGGALQVLAYEGRFYQGFSPGYGFDALGVGLLALGSPWGLLPSAFLFGILSRGSASILILGVPRGLSTILFGLLVITLAAFVYRRRSPYA